MAVAPQNIMATLRSMPDAELVKYAALHKNDPFIFPLAFQESQTRKHMRAAQQAQGGVNQPKVADQAIAEMAAPEPLPEDVGIAKLPAQNMQGMAGGGIVAFEAGGEVPRFNGTKGSEVGFWDVPENENPLSIGSAYRRWKESGLPLLPYLGVETTRKVEEKAGARQDRLRDEAMKQVNAPTSVVPEGYARPNMQNDPRLAQGYVLPSGITSDSIDIPVAASKADTGSKGGKDEGIAKLMPAAPGAGKAVTAQAAAPAGLGSIAEFAKEANAYTGADPTARQLERIEKQEAGAAGEKKDALNMALLKAGLGMMAGTSRYAFENIGKGAMAGAEEYGAAMKDLKKAALERDRMRDAAEQAAYAYKRDDVKGYRTAQEKMEDRRVEMEKAQLAARTQLQSAGITAGAHLRAAQLPPKEAQMAAMLGEGKTFEERFQSGLPKLTAIQAGKFDPRKAYTEYLVAAQRSGTGDIMPFAEFAMQFAPRVSGGGAGTVLERRD